MMLHQFHIDQAGSDEKHLYVDVDGFTVVIIRADEGVIADIYPLHVLDEALASTYAFHSEAAPDEAEPTHNSQQLDGDARARNAGPMMRKTLEYVAQMLADFEPDSLRQLGLDVALEQVEKVLAIAANNIAQESAA